MEPQGTFDCPICGVGTPHPHSEEQQAAYREEQLAGRFPAKDGWHRTILIVPKQHGWYLCREIEIPRDQYGPLGNDIFNLNPRAAQLSWFLWVREGGERYDKNIPEVLHFEPTRGWRLRNLLGDAVRSGAESRREVAATPKYWREFPSTNFPLTKEP